ncbi:MULTISPECIES: hypothetical protein [unclassified Nocardia]|uniref:hypothetical protein n=1 Tax=unclassified Nocardia TaxID=2637762 RepID=UPI00278C2487|nr:MULTISPECIES: hypothetical protein [unclassified Nocardia]
MTALDTPAPVPDDAAAVRRYRRSEDVLAVQFDGHNLDQVFQLGARVWVAPEGFMLDVTALGTGTSMLLEMGDYVTCDPDGRINLFSETAFRRAQWEPQR